MKEGEIIEEEEIPDEECKPSAKKSDETTKEEKRRLNLFRLISIGNATGQSFLFNFFSAFAVLVGVTTSALGFITSIRNLMGSLFQGAIGRLSDKYGRKYFLLLGFFLSFSIMIVLIFLNNPMMLIIISIVQATALSIIIPVWNATLGDVTKTEKRASFMGRLSAMGTAVSVSLMLALAGVFYIIEEYGGFNVHLKFRDLVIFIPEIEPRLQYGIAFGVAAINFLLCFIGALLLRETKKSGVQKKQPKMLLALKDKRFTKFFIVNSVFGLIMSLMWPIFPIAQVSVLKMNFPQIAIVNAMFSVFFSLGLFFGGKLSDRFGRKPFIIYGRAAMFAIPLVMIGAVFMGNWQMLLLSNIIGGSAMGSITVSMNAYVLDIAPEEQMGAYSGLQQVGWGILTFIGSLSSGFIATAITNNAPYARDEDKIRYMVIVMFSAIAILRFIASIGYFFIDESFPKEAREALKLKKLEGDVPDHPIQYTCEDSQTQSK
ncbi:MAG: MFS transporter [Candidatus Heimdallarchaeota archaeon]|nr:MFS transporter [Candidatus Heimdallarchaeota archaeon]